MDYGVYLVSLSLSEYRALRKAIAVLVRAGIPREDALQIIVTAHQNKARRYEGFQVAR
jgi:hypothetical protein